MPVVKVELWKGRNKEQLKKLAESVTQAVSSSVSCPPEAVHVIISEVEKEKWAIGGKLASEISPDKQ